MKYIMQYVYIYLYRLRRKNREELKGSFENVGYTRSSVLGWLHLN